jgi:hypothetical protein
MDADYAKTEFKSLMVKIRYLSEHADAAFAEVMYRELEREIGVLLPKLRNYVVKSDEGVLKSQPA